METSVVVAAPAMLAKRRVKVPPGTVVLGVLMAVEPAGVIVPVWTNCRLPGRTAVRSRLVIVWPVATSTVTVYCTGKLGPVTVDATAVVARVKSTGVTGAVTKVLWKTLG